VGRQRCAKTITRLILLGRQLFVGFSNLRGLEVFVGFFLLVLFLVIIIVRVSRRHRIGEDAPVDQLDGSGAFAHVDSLMKDRRCASTSATALATDSRTFARPRATGARPFSTPRIIRRSRSRSCSSR
jgi:hypothetical protein